MSTPKRSARIAGQKPRKAAIMASSLTSPQAHALAVTQGPVEPADEQKDECGGADSDDAAEDQVFRAGEEDVAVVGDAAGAGEGDVVVAEDDLIFGGSEEGGSDEDKEEADGDAGEGEGVGEEKGLPVHDHEADEEEAQDDEAQANQDESDLPFCRELRIS